MLLKVLDICCCTSISKWKRRGNSIFSSGKWLLMLFILVAFSSFASVDNYFRNHLSYNSLLWKQNQGIYFPNKTQNVVSCTLAVKSYRGSNLHYKQAIQGSSCWNKLWKIAVLSGLLLIDGRTVFWCFCCLGWRWWKCPRTRGLRETCPQWQLLGEPLEAWRLFSYLWSWLIAIILFNPSSQFPPNSRRQ